MSMYKKEIVSGKNAAEVIRGIIENDNVKSKDIAQKLGVTRQSVSQTLNRGKGNMSYESFYRMVTALGYEIVLKEK